MAYFADRAPTLDGTIMVELEGDMSDDEDHDAGADGDPVLVLPTRIVAVRAVPDEMR